MSMKAFARKEFLPFFSHRRNMIRFPDQFGWIRYHFGLSNGCWKWCFFRPKMATLMGKMMLNQGCWGVSHFQRTPSRPVEQCSKPLSSHKKTDWLRTRFPVHELQSSPINTAKNQQHHPQFSTTLHFYIRKYLWWLKKHIFLTMETPFLKHLWVLALCFAQPHLWSLESATRNPGAL